MGEKLAIVSPKVQTTRHRYQSHTNPKKDYQIIFRTPRIIDQNTNCTEKNECKNL